MRAVQVNFILQNDTEHKIKTGHFIMEVLKKLKEEHNLKQVHYHDCEYFEK